MFPVDPTTKAPRSAHGCKDATTDERKILALWRSCPNAGIGVATGKPSGIVAIDVDPRNGGEEGIESACGRLGALPSTTQVTTPSGGRHYWFRAPKATIACSAGKLAPGVDIRGDGGYVIAPPTARPKGGAWEWAGRAPLAQLEPEWVAALIVNTREGDRPPPTPATAWLAMLTAGIPDGQRNDNLTRLAGHLLGRGLDARLVSELVHLVNTARCRPPLPAADVDRIMGSIAARELRKRAGREAAR